METYILIAVILAVVGLAAWYVIKAKKSGRKCIGCPEGCCTSSPKESQAPSSCGGNCSCCCGCSPVQKDAE